MELFSLIAGFFVIGGLGIYRINKKIAANSERKNRWTKFLTYLFLVFGQLLCIQIGIYKWFALLVVTVGLYEMLAIRKSNAMALINLPIYLFFAFFYVLFFYEMPLTMQQFLFIIVITFDGYSQISGQLAGKTKLFPNVSPGKTLEGLFGGVIAVGFTAIILSRILGIELFQAIVIGMFGCLFSISGDFLASLYKRKNGVKDFSKIIPGHGGILDRFDSLIVSAFAFYFATKIDFSNSQTLIFAGYIILFLFIFLIAELLYHTMHVKVEVSRKLVHCCSGLVCMTFPIYLNNHWLVLALCINFIVLLVIGKRFRLLKSVNEIKRKSFGSLLFPISVYGSFLCFNYFDGEYLYFYLPILVLAVCDPLAALVGKRWPFGKYKVGADFKTVTGSGAFFISGFAIILFSLLQMNHSISILSAVLLSLGIAALATVSEGLSTNGIDNFTIPATVILGLMLVL